MPRENDPLSIIEIYARRHAKHSPRKESLQMRRDSRHSPRRQVRVTDEDIPDEVYTEEFEQASSAKMVSSEEIVDEIRAAALSSSGSRQHLSVPKKQQPFNYRTHSSIAESIKEEVNGAAESGSIEEESHLKESPSQKEIIEEDSIKEEYEGEAFDSYSGSKSRGFSVPSASSAKKQSPIRPQFPSSPPKSDPRAKQAISDLLKEMQRYEQATLGEAFVDKIEKIVNKSLA